VKAIQRQTVVGRGDRLEVKSPPRCRICIRRGRGFQTFRKQHLCLFSAKGCVWIGFTEYLHWDPSLSGRGGGGTLQILTELATFEVTQKQLHILEGNVNIIFSLASSSDSSMCLGYIVRIPSVVAVQSNAHLKLLVARPLGANFNPYEI